MADKKIVFFLGSMNRGGAERVISILSRDYAERGWKTDICALIFNSVEYELASSTVFHDFTGGQGSRISRLPYWLKSIRKFVKQNNPDVIVSFAARINVIVQIACIGLNKKIVISERNDPKYDGRGFITRLCTSLLYPSASAIVFQTERVKSSFNRKIQNKGFVIPNPIEVLTDATCSDENKIVTVGRLNTQKNHKMLLDAFAKVLNKYPEKKLHLYGDGDLKNTLIEQAEALNISQNVVFEGKISNVHEEIKDASFFVLSSDYEGLSNALLEAMMMGLPCISTDCAGSDEYIINEENGLLVPVGDTEAMYEAIMRFIEDSDLRKKCGNNAKKIAERINLTETLKRWHDIIG